MDGKIATGVGFHIRQQINAKWYLVNVLTRSIAVRPISKDDGNFQNCHDCKQPAEWFVVELTRFTPDGKRSKYPLVWGWCGTCDLGS